MPKSGNSGVGSFEPLLIPQRQTRFKGFDEKILAMYVPAV
jgi:transposase-like protein